MAWWSWTRGSLVGASVCVVPVSVTVLCRKRFKKSPPMPEAERHDVAGGPIGSVVAAFAGFARELASMTGLLFFGADTPSDYVLQKPPESTR